MLILGSHSAQQLSIVNQVNKLVAREKTLHLKGKSPNDRYWMPLDDCDDNDDQ